MRKFLKILLNIFRLIGVDPRCQNGVSKCLQLFAIIGEMYIFFVYVAEILFNWKGIETLAKVNMFPCVLMFIIKTTTLQRKYLQLMKIIEMTEEFPNSDMLGNETQKSLEKIFDYSKNAVIVFIFSCAICLVAFFSMPFISDDPSLLFDAYEYCNLHTSPCFEIRYCLQSIVMIGVACPYVLGFDSLFLHLVSEAYYVIETTKCMLRTLHTNSSDEKAIGKIVKLHVYGQSFIHELNHFYSSLMALQLLFSLGGLILSLYMVTSEGMPPSMTLLAKYGSLYLVLSFQLFVYCFGGAIIIEQTQTVSDAAYDVDWFSQTNGELRKSLSLIIQRSQKYDKITAGNVMSLNLESFVAVLRNSFSVYTLLLTMEKKAKMQ